MCGLLAFLSSRGYAGLKQDGVAKALESLHHRGPDETGIRVVDEDVVFGHKRLAVLDVAGSHEPLFYADGRYVIVFNGEIYNYVELRDELIRDHGARFDTAGDTEVIAAAYHYWGEAALQRLRGMFAFLIWDRVTRRAFAARDPFGSSRCTMWWCGTASTSPPRRRHYSRSPKRPPWERLGVDTASLSHYLTLQYVPEPHTLHRGVERLGSGECLTWTPESGLEIRRWFRPVFRPTSVDDETALFRRIRRRCATASGCTCVRMCRWEPSCPPGSTRPPSWRSPVSSTRSC